MKDRAWSVYMHIFPNGKKYIGMTSQMPRLRWRGKNHGYYTQTLILNAIDEFGWDNIKHEIICVAETKEEAERLEKEMIRKYRTNEREYGYNVQPGGCNPKGYKICDEALKKIRDSGCHKGEKNPNFGKHLSEEVRKKLSESHKGKCDIDAIRRGAKKRRGANAYNARKVKCFDKDGNYIRSFDSLADGARIMGARTQDIFNCCTGRQKTVHGIRWEYD